MVGAPALCDDCCTMASKRSTATYTPRRAYRSTDDRMLGGVASGLARHLGVPVLPVRVAFLVATAMGGLGIAAYAGLWLVLPSDPHLEESSPGLEAASRQGRRLRRRRRFEDVGPVVALTAVGIGLLVLVQGVVGGSFLFWPVLVGLVGVAVLWRQADEAQRERWVDSSGRVDFARAVVGRGGIASYARLAAGVGLLVTALLLFALQTGQVGVARDVVVAGVLGVSGLALVVGPWLFRLVSDLAEERAARVRSQERADVAAHLHDSVLQTLALIQKHSEDGRTVATLARAQERDLRSWLYGDEAATATSLASALRAAAAEVEDAHRIAVEVVTVGDAPVTDQTRPLVLAAREAMVNAAKHSGADKVDVFAEADARRTEIYVRDRGRGFDESAVPGDRMGLRNSILERVRRHGGQAAVRTAPGEGTEVRLSMESRGEDR
jgi:signal transduction histidine kinase/phage shock protein PspC (stress-responsive transcriptional regulator)